MDFSEKSKRLTAWFKSLSGQLILKAEQRSLDDMLQHIFGYYACQASADDNADLLADCQVGNHFKLVFRAELAQLQWSILCDPYFWPINNGSVDLVLLHHTLDIVDDPRRFLNEATTSIIPGGKLVIIGFNKFSIHGISCGLYPKRSNAFKGTKFISIRTLRRWLQPFGFNIEEIYYGSYLYPLDRLFKQQKMKGIDHICNKSRLPFGAFYRILASRDVHCVTLLKRPWSSSSTQFIGQPVARCRTRQIGDAFE